MRWKAAGASGHNAGDTRWTLKFAFLPKLGSDGYVYWLQDVYVKQEYQVIRSHVEHFEGWTDLEYAGALPNDLRRNA